jgi:hypothetical protein
MPGRTCHRTSGIGRWTGKEAQDGSVDLVAATLVGHRRLSPELGQEVGLLVQTSVPDREVLAMRRVLRRIPAHADAQTQPAATEQIEFCGCLATSAVSRWGRIKTPVVKCNDVMPARNPNSPNGSWNCVRTSYGPFRARWIAGSAPTTWSNASTWW